MRTIPGTITQNSQEFISRESGGRTHIQLVTRVHKEADDERMIKLIDEIEFLRSIPEEWQQHFPQVVLAHIGEDRVFYEMPHYELPTIRRLLFSGVLKHGEILQWIDRILQFSFSMFRKEILPLPENYMHFMHYSRIRRRLAELHTKTEVFKPILAQKTISINGHKYRNIPDILSDLESPTMAVRMLPEYVSRWGHSDLHFSNILIDLPNDNFICIDPRGYPFCDYYYDYGKLWHSVNGKYEFITENRFRLSGTEFELKKDDVYLECERIKEGLPDCLCRYSGEPRETVLMKAEFNEAIHFASLVPFVLEYDGQEKKAVAAYLTAVLLLNQFVEKYF